MMRRRSGKIVNVGSISGIAATPFAGPSGSRRTARQGTGVSLRCSHLWSLRHAGVYASTKAALHALSDTMRMELKPFNVSVIVVAPGYACDDPPTLPRTLPAHNPPPARPSRPLTISFLARQPFASHSAIKSEFSNKSQRSIDDDKLKNGASSASSFIFGAQAEWD